ncbi:hypothetical protein [Erwinia rhapontici]|uniref:hypothetical protein n=1 Tax=Erwinia rhapontici TaxID=55212 RepID=UPI003D36111A
MQIINTRQQRLADKPRLRADIINNAKVRAVPVLVMCHACPADGCILEDFTQNGITFFCVKKAAPDKIALLLKAFNLMLIINSI